MNYNSYTIAIHRLMPIDAEIATIDTYKVILICILSTNQGRTATLYIVLSNQ